jgi:hypothetical protein
MFKHTSKSHLMRNLTEYNETDGIKTGHEALISLRRWRNFFGIISKSADKEFNA